MRIVDFHISPDCRPRPVDWIEERISTGVFARSKPFPFHYSPKSFGNVQMRGIRRNVRERRQSSRHQWIHMCRNLQNGYRGQLFQRYSAFWPFLKQYRCFLPGTAIHKGRSLRRRHAICPHKKGLFPLYYKGFQVLATSGSYTGRVSARAHPLDVFLYVYTLRQGG